GAGSGAPITSATKKLAYLKYSSTPRFPATAAAASARRSRPAEAAIARAIGEFAASMAANSSTSAPPHDRKNTKLAAMRSSFCARGKRRRAKFAADTRAKNARKRDWLKSIGELPRESLAACLIDVDSVVRARGCPVELYRPAAVALC